MLIRNDKSLSLLGLLGVVVLGLLVSGCFSSATNNQKRDSVTSGNYGGKGDVGSALKGQEVSYLPNSTIKDRILFSTDSSNLSPEALAILGSQARWFVANPRYNILIEGHADERGTREYNIALGARRAITVREQLISRGVRGLRITTISYGKERPVAVCPDISCWSQNRRAVTLLR